MLRPLLKRMRRLLKPKPHFARLETAVASPVGSAHPLARPRFVSVYAYLACRDSRLGGHDPQQIAEFFSEKLSGYIQHSGLTPVFLQQHIATRYARFRPSQHVIVKLVVPDTAVVGRVHHLIIKPGVVTPRHVHGCFLGWHNSSPYVENPLFNASFSPCA